MRLIWSTNKNLKLERGGNYNGTLFVKSYFRYAYKSKRGIHAESINHNAYI